MTRTLARHELVVDPEQRAADVHVALETGGRYQFGKVVTIEQDAISDRLFAGYLRFAEGQPYSPERVRSTQFALEDSNYFSTITVVPGDRDPETLTVPVTIRGEPIKRDRYSVSAGYGTDTGVRGKFTWENRRVNRRGHRLQIELTASSRPDRGNRALHHPGRRSLARETRVLDRLHPRRNRRSRERALRADRQPHRGDGPLAAGAVPQAERGTVDLPRRHRSDRPAADPRRELLQPAAQLPDRLGARRRVLLRAVRQPAVARIGCLVPAIRRAAQRRSGGSRARGICGCAARSARAGSTSSPSCPPRSGSSPAATAACAVSD